MYVFLGPLTDPELASFTAKVTWGTVKPVNYVKVSDLFAKSLDLKDAYALIPADWKLFLPQVATALDSLPSVLISREDAQKGTWTVWVMQQVRKCANKKDERYCTPVDVVDALTGRVDSPRDTAGVSIGSQLRNGLLHMKLIQLMPEDRPAFFALSNGSYFSESSYSMSDWAERYWGATNKGRLGIVKAKYDPEEVFGCRHCITPDFTVAQSAANTILSTLIGGVMAVLTLMLY
jgi:hypothetical protein